MQTDKPKVTNRVAPVQYCLNCKHPFERTWNRQQYCSPDCCRSARLERRRMRYAQAPSQPRVAATQRRLDVERTCTKCGAVYYPRRASQKYCGAACYQASRLPARVPVEDLHPTPAQAAAWADVVRELRASWRVRLRKQRRSWQYGVQLERLGLPPNIAAAAVVLDMSVPTLRRRLQGYSDGPIRAARTYQRIA